MPGRVYDRANVLRTLTAYHVQLIGDLGTWSRARPASENMSASPASTECASRRRMLTAADLKVLTKPQSSLQSSCGFHLSVDGCLIVDGSGNFFLDVFDGLRHGVLLHCGCREAGLFSVSLRVGVSSNVEGGGVVQEPVEEGYGEDGVLLLGLRFRTGQVPCAWTALSWCGTGRWTVWTLPTQWTCVPLAFRWFLFRVMPSGSELVRSRAPCSEPGGRSGRFEFQRLTDSSLAREIGSFVGRLVRRLAYRLAQRLKSSRRAMRPSGS